MGISDPEYVSRQGMICPYCGSDQIRGGPVTTTGPDVAVGSVRCQNCGKKWEDVFLLTGYQHPKQPVQRPSDLSKVSEVAP